MFEAIDAADRIADWTFLGLRLPKDLVKALEVFNAVREVSVSQPTLSLIPPIDPAVGG